MMPIARIVPVACRAALLLGVPLALLGGCGNSLNAVLNRLRETNIQQERDIAALKETLKNREATIFDMQGRLNANSPPVPTLPPDRLAQLFTISRLEIQPSSDTWDAGDGKGIAGFRVFIRTLTDEAAIMPAAGTLTIEAFELPAAPAAPRRIGSWTFTPEQMKKSWYTGLGLNHFAFNCLWQSPPTLTDVTFKARFQDALTGQSFEAQRDKKIKLPPPR